MDKLNKDEFPMYHGTAGSIEGGVVRPNKGMYGVGAYATNSIDDAKEYALDAARIEVAKTGKQRLFTTVYEVEPTSNEAAEVDLDPEMDYEPDLRMFMDPKGMRTKKEVAWVPTYSQTPAPKGVRNFNDIYNFPINLDEVD